MQEQERWDGNERRTTEIGPAFPNDREPTEEELAVNISERPEPSVEDPLQGFFSNKGPLFTACWWLHYYAQTGAVVTDQDLEDRIRASIVHTQRKDDRATIQEAIAKARRWHGSRLQSAAH